VSGSPCVPYLQFEEERRHVLCLQFEEERRHVLRYIPYLQFEEERRHTQIYL
jgi:hypothetical protein